MSEEKQEALFDEDRKHDELKSLEQQVRHHSGELKDTLKKCSGFMSLLKDGPKNVTDIMFRCQHTELAASTLDLLSQQASELSDLFRDCMKKARFVAERETAATELRKELKIDAKVSGTIDDIDDDDLDEDDDDDEDIETDEIVEREEATST